MEHLEPWFVLKSVSGVGNHMFKRLFDRFKSPNEVFKASRSELLEVAGMTPNLVARLRRQKMPENAKKDFDFINDKGYTIVTMGDPDYPPLLHQIPDPPPYFYVAGQLVNPSHQLAIVGSRNATPYGVSVSKRLCAELAVSGFTIVSGMARGIDTAAHEGALIGKGRTIAVLGSGLNNIYPSENRKLFNQIIEKGAVISEFSPETEPEGYNFPIRNRIISGMSLGTIVVEATRRSGSLITARLAAEQNREVFAVPGSINSFKSTGAHLLIKQGAKLIENTQDIVDELSCIRKIHEDAPKGKTLLNKPIEQKLTENETRIAGAMGNYPVHIDDLVRKTTLSPGKLSSLLLQLELKGIIKQAPGKYFTIAE